MMLREWVLIRLFRSPKPCVVFCICTSILYTILLYARTQSVSYQIKRGHSVHPADTSRAYINSHEASRPSAKNSSIHAHLSRDARSTGIELKECVDIETNPISVNRRTVDGRRQLCAGSLDVQIYPSTSVACVSPYE